MRTKHKMRLCLERLDRKVLLSSGIADMAHSAHVEAAKSFAFNGTIYLGFLGHYNPVLNQYYLAEVSPGLYEKKPFTPMGAKVHVSGQIAHPKLLPAAALPDLSDSKFLLSNAKGSLSVTFSPSTTNTYDFTIAGGTKHFVTADGTTGTAVFIYIPKAASDAITFKSSKHPT
jgi:hypothetical protein